MLTPGSLDSAFQIYWDEMDRCRAARTYWALLHVTICLPDICAALERRTGTENLGQWSEPPRGASHDR